MMHSLNFRKFIEEVSQDVAEYGSNLVEKMKSWRPTKEKPYPSAGMQSGGDSSGIGHANSFDVAAVLAGTKPAASYDVDFANTPLGQWMLRKAAKSPNLTMSSGFGFKVGKGGNAYVVGRPENVSKIVKAYAELGHYFNPENEEELQRGALLHTIIGKNLGFPLDAIQRFIKQYEDFKRSEMNQKFATSVS